MKSLKLTRLSLSVSLACALFSANTLADKVYHTDVVVVGSGLSGMSAGLTAVQNDLDVIILEKLAGVGGVGHYPEGSLGIGTRMQKESGKGNRTALDAMNLSVKHTGWRINTATTRALLDNSGETIDWVADQGVEFVRLKTVFPDDESLWTWHIYKKNGAGVVKNFYKQIRQAGGEVLTETPASKLLIDKNGKVNGVEATDLVTGEKVTVYAKGVVLATGGFANNQKMIKQYISDAQVPNTVDMILRGPSIDGREGDGINMAIDIGAQTQGMHSVAGNSPYVNQTSEPLIRQFNGTDYQKHARTALSQPFLWVNNQGKRFYNESRGSVFVDVYNAMSMNGGIMYSIFDQSMKEKMVKEGPVTPFNAIVVPGQPMHALDKAIEIGLQEGWMHKADTPAELAKKIGLPVDNFVTTMAEVNQNSKQGFDPAFGKKKEHLLAFSDQGPYYAVEGIRAYFLTLGGVKVNEKLQPINEQGGVISGLYVTGQDIGGLHDASYDLSLEGGASGFALTSGRMAAKAIAADLKM